MQRRIERHVLLRFDSGRSSDRLVCCCRKVALQTRLRDLQTGLAGRIEHQKVASGLELALGGLGWMQI